MSEIRMKRAYDPPAQSDGARVRVDRLWPRGLKREGAKIDLWLKGVAPSAELRRWFGCAREVAGVSGPLSGGVGKQCGTG